MDMVKGIILICREINQHLQNSCFRLRNVYSRYIFFLILKITLRSRFYYHLTEQEIQDQVHRFIRDFAIPKLTLTLHRERGQTSRQINRKR